MADIHAQSFPRPWSALDMAVHVKTDICLGVTVDTNKAIAAFIIIRTSGHEAEVLTVATEQASRRQGYGQALIEAALAQLMQDKVQSLFLEVAEDNVAAQALYKACGFAPIGRRPAYYRRENGRVAAITFCKSLDAAR